MSKSTSRVLIPLFLLGVVLCCAALAPAQGTSGLAQRNGGVGPNDQLIVNQTGSSDGSSTLSAVTPNSNPWSAPDFPSTAGRTEIHLLPRCTWALLWGKIRAINVLAGAI